MDVRLMGNVEIHDGARPAPLPRAGERCVLASLALEPGRRIHIDTLIDRFWDDEPPTHAGHTMASYIRTVRKAIEDAGGQRDWLRNHRPATYELDIDPALVDYHRFTALVAEARRRQDEGRKADAVILYQQALQQRTGEALGNVTGQWSANRAFAIEQEHLDAVCAMYEQQLSIGSSAAVATHASHYILDVVPTDRIIVLAIHGLARSGQHSAISGFLDRAAQRMWELAQARPSPQVLALARQLVANPKTPRPPTTASGTPQPDQPTEEDADDPDLAGPTPAEDGADSPHASIRDDRVVMIAERNERVFQSGGDQYITMRSPPA